MWNHIWSGSLIQQREFFVIVYIRIDKHYYNNTIKLIYYFVQICLHHWRYFYLLKAKWNNCVRMHDLLLQPYYYLPGLECRGTCLCTLAGKVSNLEASLQPTNSSGKQLCCTLSLHWRFQTRTCSSFHTSFNYGGVCRRHQSSGWWYLLCMDCCWRIADCFWNWGLKLWKIQG